MRVDAVKPSDVGDYVGLVHTMHLNVTMLKEMRKETLKETTNVKVEGLKQSTSK